MVSAGISRRKPSGNSRSVGTGASAWGAGLAGWLAWDGAATAAAGCGAVLADPGCAVGLAGAEPAVAGLAATGLDGAGVFTAGAGSAGGKGKGVGSMLKPPPDRGTAVFSAGCTAASAAAG